MLKINSRVALVLCLVLIIAAHAGAQSGRVRTRPEASQKSDDKETVRLRAEEVLLPVSVRSQNGRLPTHLDRTDFIITEDGKRQRITSVMRTPANILLLLDTSGEVASRKNASLNRDLALKIVESLAEEDRAAIVTYGDKVSLLAGWTADKQELRHALNWGFRPGIRARFYDSILYAAAEVLPKVTGRRSVLLLTDGVDSNGAAMYEKALEALHHARATVYIASHNAMIIGELKPRVFNPLAWYEMIDPKVRKRYEPLRRYVRDLEAAELTLKGFAEETGGAMWNPLTKDQFVTVNARIIEELATEYVIAYSSERAADDAGFHAVKVYVTRRDINVRSRKGLYSNLPAGIH